MFKPFFVSSIFKIKYTTFKYGPKFPNVASAYAFGIRSRHKPLSNSKLQLVYSAISFPLILSSCEASFFIKKLEICHIFFFKEWNLYVLVNRHWDPGENLRSQWFYDFSFHGQRMFNLESKPHVILRRVDTIIIFGKLGVEIEV